MKKILQVFKRIFSRKRKDDGVPVCYLCDPEKAKGCIKVGCWYEGHGPCKCTSKKQYAQTDRNGRPIVASVMDIWNEEYREYCLMHPDIYMEE